MEVHIASDKVNGKASRPIIKFIRAAYRRSAAICHSGKVYVWGQGSRFEIIKKPILLFHDHNGVKELQLGTNHGVYIQEQNGKVYSWGNNTLG